MARKNSGRPLSAPGRGVMLRKGTLTVLDETESVPPKVREIPGGDR
jgi:hypothetical protein